MTKKKGIALSGITNGGNADNAGLRAGDLILSVNGTSVDSGFALSAALKNAPNDQPYPVEFCREDGEPQTVDVQPGKLGAQTPPNAMTNRQAPEARQETSIAQKPKSFWTSLVMFVATINLIVSILVALGGLIGFSSGVALFSAVKTIITALFFYGVAHLAVSIWENSEIIKANQKRA